MSNSGKARFIDARALDSDRIGADICIIGAGPAGVTLANALAGRRDVLLLESGTIDHSHYQDDLNAIEYATNFGYRIDFKNRCRHLGGTANLWAGRLVPYRFDPVLDSDWGDLAATLPTYYPAAASTLGLKDGAISDWNHRPEQLVAYWANRTERFDRQSRHYSGADFRVLYNSTFTGDYLAGGDGIDSITCRTQDGKTLQVQARTYVIACGGIESVRLLMLMARANPEQFQHLPALGRYVMDHPKITHGRAVTCAGPIRAQPIQAEPTSLHDYRTEFLADRVRQVGRRSTELPVRVYCNLVAEKRRVVERFYSKAANLYMAANRRYGSRSADRTGEIIYTVEPHEILPRKALQILDRLGEVLEPDRGPKVKRIVSYLEMRPRASNRITLSESHADRFANPLPRLELHLHADELAAAVDFYQGLAVTFAPHARIEFDASHLSQPRHYSDASHHLGGARYSATASEAVLNKDLSVRGMKNCRVLSTAAFPTGGVENPTFLLVAMAHYLADELRASLTG